MGQQTDFDFIDGVFVKIAEKKNRLGLEALTEKEKVVLQIWHSSGIIENGGFQYFFEQELDAEAIAKAYEAIGFQKPAEILRLALSLFPKSLPHQDWDERIKYIKKHEEEFQKLSEGFWATSDEMKNYLADYIRKMPSRSNP